MSVINDCLSNNKPFTQPASSVQENRAVQVGNREIHKPTTEQSKKLVDFQISSNLQQKQNVYDGLQDLIFSNLSSFATILPKLIPHEAYATYGSIFNSYEGREVELLEHLRIHEPQIYETMQKYIAKKAAEILSDDKELLKSALGAEGNSLVRGDLNTRLNNKIEQFSNLDAQSQVLKRKWESLHPTEAHVKPKHKHTKKSRPAQEIPANRTAENYLSFRTALL